METLSTSRLEDARKTIFPDYVDSKEFKEIMIMGWNATVISSEVVNSHQSIRELPTLPIELVMKAGKILSEKLVSMEKSDLTVLEIMAGNCSGSRILFNTVAKKTIIKKWIATDIIDYKKTIREKEFEFHKFHGLESVRTFPDSDILLMMCPPPNKVANGNCVNSMSLCDYYSIREFIDFNKGKDKLIVFISEMGASSGTEGLYNFMLTNPEIKLIHREMLMSGYNQYGLIEMEIFIFSIY
jgi:hypothetical protein